MTRKTNLIIIGVFLTFIAVFFAANLLTPDNEFSQRENRYLQQSPVFTAERLFTGKFTSEFEKYTTDQFVLRDSWTALKARCELLLGKKENNAVYYGKNDTLIERFDAPDDAVIDANMDCVNALTQNVDIPVYFALIPGQAELEPELLPKNAPTDSQTAVIERAYTRSEAQTVDIAGALAAHSGEYIFYRTDHHWTSLGALYGYEALCAAWGLPCPARDAYDQQTASEQFYGTVYSRSGFSWVSPDSIETFVHDDGSVCVERYENQSAVSGRLYDTTYLSVKDKYSMFLGGNAPRVILTRENTNGPRLLVVRDSYTDSLAPFLTQSFARIDLIDLRYYRESLKDYVEAGEFDMVLILYSVDTFCTETNLFLLEM